LGAGVTDIGVNSGTGGEPAGAHAPHRGNLSVAILSVTIPILIAMLALLIAPGVLQMAAEFGAMTAQLVQVLPAVVMILGAAVAGYLSERWGRRAVIIALLAVYAVSGVAGYFAPNLAVLVASRVVIGFAGGVLLTTIYAVIGEYFEGHARERLLGFMSMAASASSVAMLALGGKVVEDHGWRTPFLFYLAALLLIPLAMIGLHKGKTVSTAITLSWKPVLRHWPIYLLLTAYTVGMYMLVIQGPFLLGAQGVTSPSTIGLLISVSSLFGALGGAFYGLMRRVLGFREMFIFISVAIGIGLPLAALAQGDTIPFIFAAFVVGLGIGVIEPTVASELLLRTPEPLHDRAMGLNVAAMFLGQFLNPFVVAPLYALSGAPFAFQTVGAIYLVGAVLFLIAVLAGRRREPHR
jgi:MFS family permease